MALCLVSFLSSWLTCRRPARSITHTHADTRVWVIGQALLFRTKGDRVYVSLWPQQAVLFCLCSGSCGSVVHHWIDRSFWGFLFFLFSIIISMSIYNDEEFTADQVSSGRGRGGLLKSNKATTCMCQTQSRADQIQIWNSLPVGIVWKSNN